MKEIMIVIFGMIFGALLDETITAHQQNRELDQLIEETEEEKIKEAGRAIVDGIESGIKREKITGDYAEWTNIEEFIASLFDRAGQILAEALWEAHVDPKILENQLKEIVRLNKVIEGLEEEIIRLRGE